MSKATEKNKSTLRVVWWEEEGVGMIDQTLLPHEEREILCDTLEKLWEAIKNLRVRGAPAIGVSAAYGAVLAARLREETDPKKFANKVREGCDYLATSRPTAVNLFWALDRMKRVLSQVETRPVQEQRESLLGEFVPGPTVSVARNRGLDLGPDFLDFFPAGRHASHPRSGGFGGFFNCGGGGGGGEGNQRETLGRLSGSHSLKFRVLTPTNCSVPTIDRHTYRHWTGTPCDSLPGSSESRA